MTSSLSHNIFTPIECIELPDATLTYHPDCFSLTQSNTFLTQLLDSNIIHWQQKNIKIFNRIIPEPRLNAWYGDEEAIYTYSGLVNYPLPWIPILLELKKHVEQITQTSFNSVLLNRYRNGSDSMGWHSDDEPELGINPVIASLSLGATRQFQFKHRTNKQLPLHRISLTPGSLLVMSGNTQKYWKHCLPKVRQSDSVGERVNLTFRYIMQ
jgi:alkylated DNA repair dioxygenase AlkB